MNKLLVEKIWGVELKGKIGPNLALLHSKNLKHYISKVGQGSRQDSPTTRLCESCRVSLGDGGDPRHRRVSPIWLV